MITMTELVLALVFSVVLSFGGGIAMGYWNPGARMADRAADRRAAKREKRPVLRLFHAPGPGGRGRGRQFTVVAPGNASRLELVTAWKQQCKPTYEEKVAVDAMLTQGRTLDVERLT